MSGTPFEKVENRNCLNVPLDMQKSEARLVNQKQRSIVAHDYECYIVEKQNDNKLSKASRN